MYSYHTTVILLPPFFHHHRSTTTALYTTTSQLDGPLKAYCTDAERSQLQVTPLVQPVFNRCTLWSSM